jgi:hypothetical protein
VGTEPAPSTRFVDPVAALQHDRQLRIAYWIVMLGCGGALLVLWFADGVGPGHPVYALLVTAWTFVLTPGVAVPALRLMPPRWHRVPAGERVLYRVLGVSIFAWLLERSGWNRRNIYPTWGFSINRTRLPVRAQAARGGCAAHAACFAIHALLSAAAFFTGHAWGALWILLPGIVLHLYPVLLQRSIMLRLQPLLEKADA